MSLKQLDHINFITQNMPATITFYTTIVGMVVGEKITYAPDGIVYLYIPGHHRSILHIGDSNITRQSQRFHEYAKFPTNKNDYATGAQDHFCLTYDLDDYDSMLIKLKKNNITYETYCSPEGDLKQIWAFDPNGIRVEFNFY